MSDKDILEWMAENNPETYQFWQSLVEDELKLLATKHHDYGPQNIALGQLLENDKEIRFALIGVMVRMQDKVARIITLLRNDADPKHESIEDSLMDISNYANIGLCLQEGVWAK